MAKMNRLVSSQRLLTRHLLLAALLLPLRAQAQVLPWPGEELMTYGLAYQAAVTDDRLVNSPWIVLAAREGMRSFRDAARTEPWHRLDFLQSFYVQELDLEAGSLRLVYANVGGSLPSEAQITEDWGWAELDDLLLSHRAFRDPDNFVPQRALVRTEMNPSGFAKVPKLYKAPSKEASQIAELEYTSFFYVFKVSPSVGKPYSPLWGYDWYFVASEPYLNVAPGTSRSAVGRRGLAGWLQGGHTLIWNTREALEPLSGRTRSAHVFNELTGALEYARDSNRTGNASLLDPTPNDKPWIGQRFRYPVLNQEEKSGGAQAQLVAFQGRVRFDPKVGPATDYGPLESELLQAREAAGRPKLIFIFDATVSMCPYITETVEAAEEIFQRVRAKGIPVEVGAVVYKDKVDEPFETQAFPLQSDYRSLKAELEYVSCSQARDSDYEESVYAGIYAAWDEVLGRSQNAHTIYLLMGDAGSSAKENVRATEIASHLTGLAPTGQGSWNVFSFHAFHIQHPADNPSESAAMASFERDVQGELLGTIGKLERHLGGSGRPSPHSYQQVNVGNAAARRAAAQRAAERIAATFGVVQDVSDCTERSLATGAPVECDDPIATTILENYLRSRLGADGLQLAREQRTQIFYQGWVTEYTSDRDRIMAPVLFLTRRETSELLDIVERMREFGDCEALKDYFREIIGTVAPDEEHLPISLLIEKIKGFSFRSDLLEVPYGELDALCSVENAPKFVNLLQAFEEVDAFLFTMVSDDSAAPTDSRKYELLSGDFYWVPMDKLP